VVEGRAVVKFAGQHDSLVKMLDRNGKKEAVAKAFTQVLQRDVGVTFEIDATAAAPVAPPTSSPASSASPGSAPSNAKPAAPTPSRFAPVAPPAPSMPEPQGIKLTQDMKDGFYKDVDLVRAIVDQLGGEIVKVEDA
jgi:hypothetical protein